MGKYTEERIFLRPGEKFEIKNLSGVFGWWVVKGKGKILDVYSENKYEIFPENFPDDIDRPPVNPLEIRGNEIVISADENNIRNLVIVFFSYKF